MQPANTADGRSTPRRPAKDTQNLMSSARTRTQDRSPPEAAPASLSAARVGFGVAGPGFFFPLCVGCSIRSLERKEMRTSSRARAVFAGWGNLSLGARTARPRARARVGPTAHRNATSKVYPSPSPTTRSRGGTRHHTCARRGRRAFGDEPYYATDA